MAITIKQAPQLIMPVYNNIVYTVDSNNKTQCQFNYICDVYVNGAFVTRLKRVPAGANGYADFEVNKVLEDYVSYDLKNDLLGSTLFAVSTNSMLQYVLKFGEEYDNSLQCDAGTTIYPNLTNTSTAQAFNGALQYKEWLDWDYTDYFPTATLDKFLTTTPNNVLATYGSQMVYNIFAQNSTVSGMQVLTYDNSDALIGTYVYANGLTLPSGTSVLSIGVGPANLNGTTLAVGTQPVITSEVAYYTIQLVNGSLTPISELKTIKLDKRYSKFDYNRFWFLNRLGGFDSYTYTLSNTKTVNSQRNDYDRVYGSYTGSTWTYNLGNRGKTTLNVNAQESNSYNSNWMTEKESKWMQELFTSPEVYMIDSNKDLCFSSFVYFSQASCPSIECPPVFYITLPGVVGVVGGEIYLNFGDDETFGYLAGTYEVTAQTEFTTTVEIGLVCIGQNSPPDCIIEGDYNVCGLAYAIIANLDPVIISTPSYDEKVKAKTRNINYTIEVQKAYQVNVQRN